MIRYTKRSALGWAKGGGRESEERRVGRPFLSRSAPPVLPSPSPSKVSPSKISPPSRLSPSASSASPSPPPKISLARSVQDLILQRFLKKPPFRIVRYETEYSLYPEGENPGDKVKGSVQSRIQIDAVAWGEDGKIYVCEIKPYLNRAVIGEALCAKVMWEKLRPEDKGKVVPVVIVGRGKPILEEIARDLGVKVVTYEVS